MTVHPDQENVGLLCEEANFVDSGFQSFHEQVRGIARSDIPEAAFFAGVALALKLSDYFNSSGYTDREAQLLIGLIYEEVNDYMSAHGMHLEWEPHIPKALQS